MQSISTGHKSEARFTDRQGTGRSKRGRQSKRSACPAADLAFYKLSGQPVRLSDRNLARLEKKAQQANFQAFIRPVKAAMPLIRALHEQGFVPEHRLTELCTALKSQNNTVLSGWLVNALQAALNSVMSSALAEINTVLSRLPLASNIVPKLSAYKLYGLTASSLDADGEDIRIHYSCYDFFQHHQASVDSVGEPYRSAYASLLNLLILQGDGVWQVDAARYEMNCVSDFKTKTDYKAVSSWAKKLDAADNDEIHSVIKSGYRSKATKQFIEEMSELFWEDIVDVDSEDSDEVERLKSTVQEAMSWLDSQFTLEQLTGKYKTFEKLSKANLPDTPLGEAIKQVASIAAAFPERNYEVFSQVEETWGGFGLVIQPFSQSHRCSDALNGLSDAIHSAIMNCGEDVEAFELDIIHQSNWFSELKRRMQSTALMMYIIELANSDLVPKSESKAQ
ncbi:hypothetical protein [Rheinheimera hassiensis]|uniref:hypothetical protein n=1 Tax=Rheinheimera hassiensis TaxID=1193627 RepID=UPI001F063117|nr:hypothetical protein [Rheinheimera hassiensis]